MDIHEYQAKELFREYGVPVPPALLAYSVAEALQHATTQGGNAWVLKAQVHAGGRGKAGGVKLAYTMTEVEDAVTDMFGKRLITGQSSPQGQPINCVLVQTKVAISRELYLALVVDRNSKRITVMASDQGGMDVEDSSRHRPDSILRVMIEPLMGLQNYQIRHISAVLTLVEHQTEQLAHILRRLYQLFLDKDLSLIEINPLIIDEAGNLLCLDAKISVDDNALYRQKKLAAWRDVTQEDEKEVIASQHGLSYVSLDGNIGCIVNGAGLAMATMDIIKFYGGEPANFLDVGGNATADRIAEACRLIFSDPKVRAVLVNIFGGIVRCDLIATGLTQALKLVAVDMPMIIRLAGTNVEQGKNILAEKKLPNIVIVDDLADAAQQVLLATKGMS